MKVAEIQVSYSTKTLDRIKIKDSKSVYQVIINKWNLEIIELQEEVKIILLNRANEVLGVYELSKGGTSGTIVDIKLILSVALKCNAHSIIMCHNHPSGNLKPSKADIDITSKLKKACEYLDLVLLDHLIVTKDSYYSFGDEGVL